VDKSIALFVLFFYQTLLLGFVTSALLGQMSSLFGHAYQAQRCFSVCFFGIGSTQRFG
jgi:hypothetical protein